MNLQIVQIADPAVPGKERVHISVLADCNLSFFILWKTFGLADDQAGNGPIPAFWFPTVQAKRGDQVVVYTGSGKRQSIPAFGGQNTNHFLYWEMKQTIFNSPNDLAVIGELSSWQSQKRP